MYQRKFSKRTKKSKCPRVGCGNMLPAEIDEQKFKRLGNMHICRGCYQAAWRLAKEKQISMEQAWKLLPPKTQRKGFPFWQHRWKAA